MGRSGYLITWAAVIGIFGNDVRDRRASTKICSSCAGDFDRLVCDYVLYAKEA